MLGSPPVASCCVTKKLLIIKTVHMVLTLAQDVSENHGKHEVSENWTRPMQMIHLGKKDTLSQTHTTRTNEKIVECIIVTRVRSEKRARRMWNTLSYRMRQPVSNFSSEWIDALLRSSRGDQGRAWEEYGKSKEAREWR